MNNVNNDAKDASAVNGSQNVNLVQSIIRFDCNGYNEKEDADYQPDPEVEEERKRTAEIQAQTLEANIQEVRMQIEEALSDKHMLAKYKELQPLNDDKGFLRITTMTGRTQFEKNSV